MICFGKISKLATRHNSLHNHNSSIDFDFLAKLAKELGASGQLIKTIKQCNTSLEAMEHCEHKRIPLADRISELAREQALTMLQNKVGIDVYCPGIGGSCVGRCLSA